MWRLVTTGQTTGKRGREDVYWHGRNWMQLAESTIGISVRNEIKHSMVRAQTRTEGVL